jgi:nucleoid-associated protein YgaU
MFGSGLDSEHAFDRLPPVSRTRVRRRRLVLSVATAIVAGAWAAPLAAAVGDGGGAEPATSRSYVVRGGDTLWRIAERVAPGQDPRRVVDAIADANGVDAGALAPGQLLLIPAFG